MPDWLSNPFYNIVADYVDNIYNPISGEVSNWLKVSADGSYFAELITEGSGYCWRVFNALIPIAGILLVIYMFTSLIDKVTKELASTQVAVKFLMELLVAAMLLLHGYSLVIDFASVGDDFIALINANQGDQGGLVAEAANKYHLYYVKSGDEYIFPDAEEVREVSEEWDEYLDEHEGSYFGNTFSLLLLNLVAVIVHMFAIAAAVGRLIQLAVYICLSPIAIVNVFGEGMHSQGIRFFKKLFACAIQGPAMAIILYLSSALSSSQSIEGWTYIALQLATLMALFKVSSYANDIVL